MPCTRINSVQGTLNRSLIWFRVSFEFQYFKITFMLKILRKNETLKNVLINTLGNYLNIFFITLFALVIVRILSPAEYGVLSVLLGIAYVLANILDLGVSAILYANIPQIYENKKRLRKFVKTSFLYQSTISIVVISFLILSFKYLDTAFFKTKATNTEFIITGISILFFVWQNFLINSLLAAKKVFEVNLYLNTANLVKTAVLIFLIISKNVSIASVMFTFGIIGPAIFFLLTIINRKDAFKYTLGATFEKKELNFSYILTFFVASQFFSLATRIDLFFLSYYLTKDIVGYYGLAQKIVLTITATVTSITQILSPKFAKAKSRAELKKIFKESFKYLLLPTLLFILVFFTPTKIFEFVFTKKFVATAQIAKYLSLAYVLFPIGNIPFLFFLYTVKKPKYILFANILLLVIIGAGSYFGIPKYGVYAPIMSIFLAGIITIGFLTLKMKSFLVEFK